MSTTTETLTQAQRMLCIAERYADEGSNGFALVSLKLALQEMDKAGDGATAVRVARICYLLNRIC
jgi:hypothetical protein